MRPTTGLAGPAWRWLLLLGVPYLLYGMALGYPLTGTDDVIYYFHNPALLHGWRSLLDVWRHPFFDDYAPVTQLTLWLDLQWHPHEVLVGRLQQLAWLGLGGVACERLIWRLTSRPQVALLLALAYVIHPVCSEAALWLAERKNLVAIALTLWSIERHIAWRQGAGYGALVASVLLCPLAILAKAHAVVIPAVIACYEAVIDRTRWTHRCLAVVPTGLLATAFVVISIASIHLYRSDADMVLGGSLPAAVWCDGAILCRYLLHVVLPQHLALFYAVVEDPHRWPILLGAWLCVLLVIAVTTVAARERRTTIFAWAAAACAILPAINLKPLPLPMSDHYLQWSLPWILLALAPLLLDILERHRVPRTAAGAPPSPADGGQGRRVPSFAPVIAVCILLFLTILTVARIPAFRSPLDLDASNVQNQPTSANNWGCYCDDLADAGKVELAGRAARRAIACSDAHRLFSRSRITVLIMAALACARTDGLAASDALLAAHRSLVDPRMGQLVLGVVLLQEGRAEEARRQLRPLWTPELAAAARDLDDACRARGCLPWDLPPVSFDRFTNDTRAYDDSISHLLQSLTALAQADLDTGRLEEAATVVALVLNVNRRYAPALGVYRTTCTRLHRTDALQRLDRDVAPRPDAGGRDGGG